MKNMKKKVMTMFFAAMMTISTSAFAAVPMVGYSENGDYTAVVITDAPQTPTAQSMIGYSENGEYQAARA